MKTDKLLITNKELQQMLSCSYRTAVKIGEEAGARLQIGKAVRWKVKNIEEYLAKTKDVVNK